MHDFFGDQRPVDVEGAAADAEDLGGVREVDALARGDGGPGWDTVPIAFANGDGSWNVTNSAVGAFGGWATSAGVKVVTGNFSGTSDLTDIALVGGPGWNTVPIAFATTGGSWTFTT